MEGHRGLLLALIVNIFSIVHLVHAQNPEGFISLDCGLPAKESPYTESTTSLVFTSDANFISSGISTKLPKHDDYKPYNFLRYFPDGTRHCYDLSVKQGTNYLIRASFVYGNYDGRNIMPRFDLYIGPNIWAVVSELDLYSPEEEIIHMTKSTSLQICLVKTGPTTPFISTLELRPLRNDNYITQSGSLKLMQRMCMTETVSTLRYPDDVYDRLWYTDGIYETKAVKTALSVNSTNPFELPQVIIRSAATPVNSSEPITVEYGGYSSGDQVYLYLHFAEIQTLKASDNREFDIVWANNIKKLAYKPKVSQIDTLLNTSPNKCDNTFCKAFLVRTQRDLSINRLSGEVPEFLANMKSLSNINLSWNNLKGLIPPALEEKRKNGLKLKLPITKSEILTKKRRFTYSEVEAVTNKFERVIGEGGFGIVYHGHLNDTEQVAVKLLSHSSTQGYKQFKAEVELLLRVHHTNLVNLVGYCNEEDHLALVYEYAANGDLKQHLSGESSSAALNWASRLGIATETAQGLEYLHIGCEPPMIHRDVKTTNILLDEHFHAKLADFGLSRSFPVGVESHVSTNVAGTPGYLDPEYYRTNWLTEKSDVYSMGIVLLEIITNQPVIQQVREKPHIAEWVGLMLTKGDIKSIMDPKLNGEYDSSSVWKALELAMSCVNPSSGGRPTMSQVISELKECLIYENSRKEGRSEVDSKSSIELSTSFTAEVTPDAR
uniref:Putative receptor-like protein kinase n=1 Tax=Arabidopsis thaliana TaxID=3702 RepID=O81070_ARATH|nr:putative receptor-like protein kinase [Arabidopsis thaliana]